MYILSKLPPEVRELIRRHGHLYEKILFRSRPLYLLIILLAFLHILLHPLPVLRRVKNAYTFKLKELENEEKDLFFVSAYYYGKEYSMYENQVSLVFVAPRDANWERRQIVVIRSNETNSVLETMRVRRASPHNVCKFVTLVGSIILKDELLNLEILVNRNVADISYLPADAGRRDLVVCTPPIYHSARWQNVLLISHIYARFGGHLQAYVSSATLPFFQLLEEIQRIKGVSVDPLPDFYGSSRLGEIEFGGVTVANCDCLNKYKSSASFITFLDWDEIIFPTSHDSYFYEYAHFFESEIYVGLLEFKDRRNHSKIVTRPLLIDSVWVNEPAEKPYKMSSKQMSPNKVYQLTEKEGLDEMIEGNFPGNEILRTDDLQAIRGDLKRTISETKMAGIISRLQKEPATYCSKSFSGYYSEFRPLECPGPYLCTIPSRYPCMKSDARFELLPYTTNFYQPHSHVFTISVCSL